MTDLPRGWQMVRLGEVIEVTPFVSIKKGTKTPFVEMAQLDTNKKNVTTANYRPFKSGTKISRWRYINGKNYPLFRKWKNLPIQR